MISSRLFGIISYSAQQLIHEELLKVLSYLGRSSLRGSSLGECCRSAIRAVEGGRNR